MSRRQMAPKFVAARKSPCDSERLRKRRRPRGKLRNLTRNTGADDHGFAGAKKRVRKQQSGGRAQAENSTAEESLTCLGGDIFADRRKCAVRKNISAKASERFFS